MNNITLTYTVAALPGITDEDIQKEIAEAIERMNTSSLVRFEMAWPIIPKSEVLNKAKEFGQRLADGDTDAFNNTFKQ